MVFCQNKKLNIIMKSSTFNRLTPKLPERQKLQFYSNMLITESSLIKFQRRKYARTTKLPKEELLSMKLVQILDDTLMLNKLFLTLSNYESTHIFDGDTDEEKFKFERKVMKNIIEILFNVGTPFYRSIQKVRNKNNTNKKGYSTYIISILTTLYISIILKNPETKKNQENWILRILRLKKKFY